MRESRALLTPNFSTNRSVREYTERHYLSAAAAYRVRAADNGAIGAQLIDWRRTLDNAWPALRFGDVKVTSDGAQHVFDVGVHLGDLDPQAVQVELYADATASAGAERHAMERLRASPGDANQRYRASVRSVRPATDYTARLIPRRDGVAIPLEASHSLAPMSRSRRTPLVTTSSAWPSCVEPIAFDRSQDQIPGEIKTRPAFLNHLALNLMPLRDGTEDCRDRQKKYCT